MRKSKIDPLMILICTVLFIYFFFTEYPSQDAFGYVTINYSYIFASMSAVMFCFLYFFSDELEPVDRHWVKQQFKRVKPYLRWKLRQR